MDMEPVSLVAIVCVTLATPDKIALSQKLPTQTSLRRTLKEELRMLSISVF